MSLPTESTPLLVDNNGHAIIYDPSQRPHTPRIEVHQSAHAILSDLRNDPSAPLREVIPPEAELTTILYALTVLYTSSKRVLDGGISARISAQQLDTEVGERLVREVGRLLDEAGSGEEHGVDDATLLRSLWERWEVQDATSTSAVELIASDCLGSYPFISHPLIVHLTDHIFVHGPSSGVPTDPGPLHALERGISPWRANILHFASLTILLTFTILIVLRPDDSTYPRSINSLDIGWMILALGYGVQALQHPFPTAKTFTLLPTILAFLIYPVSRPSALAWQQASITFLTVSILLPSPGSITFLFPSLLPVSVRLFRIVRDGFSGWTFVCPLLLIYCGIMSISLNGDVYRGFSAYPPYIFETQDPQGQATTEPIESGVAPYETRVAIFATIIILLYLAVCLSISGMSRFEQTPTATGQRVSLAGVGSMAWEEVHGLEMGKLARIKLIIGCIWLSGDMGRNTGPVLAGVGGTETGENEDEDIVLRPAIRISPAVPVPLNLLLLPLDTVILTSRLLALAELRRANEAVDWFGVLRYSCSVILLGLPCWIIGWLWILPRHRQHAPTRNEYEP